MDREKLIAEILIRSATGTVADLMLVANALYDSARQAGVIEGKSVGIKEGKRLAAATCDALAEKLAADPNINFNRRGLGAIMCGKAIRGGI